MKRRKFISLLAVVCLLAALIPAAAFADEAVPETAGAVSTETSVPSETSSSEDSISSALPADTGTAAQEQAPAVESSDAPTSTQLPQTEDPKDPQDPDSSVSEEEPMSQPDGNTHEPMDETVPGTDVSVPDPAASDLSAEETEKTSSEENSITVTAEKTVSGIKVSGGIEGKDWVYDSKEQMLIITKDGLAVSGTATNNLTILCTMAVSALTMENLNQGSHSLALFSGLDSFEENDSALDALLDGKVPDVSLDITVKGKNQVSLIIGVGNVTLTGTKNSYLDLTASAAAVFGDLDINSANINTESLSAGRDLSIRDSKLKVSLMTSGRDINILGKSRVTLSPTKELEDFLSDGYTPALAIAGRNINIDLAPGGIVKTRSVKVTGKDPFYPIVYPMMAMGHINITKGSNVVTPNGAHVETINLYGDKVQVLMDGYNTGSTAPAAGTHIASSASPETGDDSMNGLLVLYGALILSGAAALAIRRKNI